MNATMNEKENPLEYQGYVSVLRKKIKEDIKYIETRKQQNHNGIEYIEDENNNNKLPDVLEDFVQTHGKSLDRFYTILKKEQFEKFIGDLDFNITLHISQYVHRTNIRKSIESLRFLVKMERELKLFTNHQIHKKKKFRLRFCNDTYYNIDVSPNNIVSCFCAEDKYDLILQADEYIYKNSYHYYDDDNKKHRYAYLLDESFMNECKEDFEDENVYSENLSITDEKGKIVCVFANNFIGLIDYMIYKYFQTNSLIMPWFQEIIE